MPDSTRTNIATAVALLWNSGVPGKQISARYHKSENWYHYQLALARKLGIEVKEYRAPGGTLTEDERKDVMRRLASGEKIEAIASALRRGKKRIVECREELRRLEQEYRAMPEAAVAKAGILPARRVAVRFGLNGALISLPCLRCLDPVAARA